MSPEGKRALIAAVRRVFLAGLVLLTVWFLLIGLRGAIPEGFLEQMNEETEWLEEGQRYDPADWDWSRSLWTLEPIGEKIGERLGSVAWLLGMGGILSLAIAALLLFIGVLISRVTEQPPWLAQVRRVLRLVLVSGGVSAPLFIVGTLFIVFPAIWWGWEYTPPRVYQGVAWWPVFFVSLLPAWLLVQAGHGELANWPGKLTGPYGLLARHIGIRLVVRLLKMAGAIIVVAIVVEQIFGYPGWGRIFIDAAMQRDFPVLFGTAWVFALIVVLARLAAELIEVAYNHFGRQPVSAVPAEEPVAPRVTIPRGWLFFSLALVLISIMVAVAAPAMATHGYNEINLADRLVGPSAEHILGTDNLGRDVFSRLLFGIRIDLQVGLMSAGILSVVAIGWAALAAYLRKANNWLGDTLEDVVMLPRDVICAFPWLVLLLLLMSMIGDYGVVLLVLISSLVLLPRAVGMMRETYSSPPVGRGWLYSVLWSVPVMLLLTVAGAILYISSLSYLGFGILPPSPELGGILSGAGRTHLLTAPWMALGPAFCLALLSLVWVMTGDALLERLGFRSKAVWAEAIK